MILLLYLIVIHYTASFREAGHSWQYMYVNILVRPKSATQRAVEEKVFSLARGMTVESDEDSDNGETLNKHENKNDRL